MNEVWVPADIDVHTASVARMYDYFLGGGHNLEVDRQAARQAIAAMPQIVASARANRAFLQRAVRACLDMGIRQFLDLGSGIPTVGHVHEIAQSVDPTATVAYVDTDPIAVAHTELLLADVPGTSVTRADMTQPATVLGADGVAGLLDFGKPIAVIAAAILHFVPDTKNPTAILKSYREATAPDSTLIFSHGGDDYDRPERLHAVADIYRRTSHPGQGRNAAQILTMLDGWDLLAPGLVDATMWRPDNPDVTTPDRAAVWAVVGRRP